MISLVQTASSNNATVSLTVGVANHTLIAVVLWAGNPGSLPIDNHNNVWISAGQSYSGQPFFMPVLNPYVQIFYSLNVGTGSTSVVFPTDNKVMATFLAEYSGISTFVTNIGNAGYVDGISPFTTANINTKPNDLLFAVGTCNGTNMFPTNMSGFVQRISMTNPNVSVADQIAIGGLYEATFSATNADNYTVLMSSFR